MEETWKNAHNKFFCPPVGGSQRREGEGGREGDFISTN